MTEVKWLSELNELLEKIRFWSYSLGFLADCCSQFTSKKRVGPRVICIPLGLAQITPCSSSEAQNPIYARKIRHKLALIRAAVGFALFFEYQKARLTSPRVTYAGTDPSSPRRTAPGPLPAGSTEARRRADTCWPLPARPRPLRGRGGQAPPSRGRGVRCPASTWAGSTLPRLHVGGACPGPARPQGAWALPWQPSLGGRVPSAPLGQRHPSAPALLPGGLLGMESWCLSPDPTPPVCLSRERERSSPVSCSWAGCPRRPSWVCGSAELRLRFQAAKLVVARLGLLWLRSLSRRDVALQLRGALLHPHAAGAAGPARCLWLLGRWAPLFFSSVTESRSVECACNSLFSCLNGGTEMFAAISGQEEDFSLIAF